MFKNRSTTDIVVIILTTMVALLMILLGIGAIIAKMNYPDMDIKSASELFGNVLTTVVGALVGFIGGRAAGRAEANGAKI